MEDAAAVDAVLAETRRGARDQHDHAAQSLCEPLFSLLFGGLL